jgi:uncharacterized protein
MDAGAILHELTYATDLPREALHAASARRAELLPKFLGWIEDYLGQEPALRANPTPLFFIFHVLGEWREKTAYRPLARLLLCPADDVDAIFGDATAETCHRVMAAVFDGDPQPLYEIILDPNAEEFIRSRMCEALAMVTLRGGLDRAQTSRFLRDAYNELQPQRLCYVWFGWQSAIAMLGFGELKVLVKRAFDRGFIDRYIVGFDDFKQDLKRGSERPGEPWQPGDDEYALFGDTVELVTLSKSCPGGIASKSSTARTGKHGRNRTNSISSSASLTITRSGVSAETTPALAAAAKNSRSAACRDQKATRPGAVSAAPPL